MRGRHAGWQCWRLSLRRQAAAAAATARGAQRSSTTNCQRSWRRGQIRAIGTAQSACPGGTFLRIRPCIRPAAWASTWCQTCTRSGCALHSTRAHPPATNCVLPITSNATVLCRLRWSHNYTFTIHLGHRCRQRLRPRPRRQSPRPRRRRRRRPHPHPLQRLRPSSRSSTPSSPTGT